MWDTHKWAFYGFQHTPSLVSVLRNSELTGKVRAIILLGAGNPVEVNPYPVAIKYPVWKSCRGKSLSSSDQIPSLDETRNPGSDTMLIFRLYENGPE